MSADRPKLLPPNQRPPVSLSAIKLLEKSQFLAGDMGHPVVTIEHVALTALKGEDNYAARLQLALKCEGLDPTLLIDWAGSISQSRNPAKAIPLEELGLGPIKTIHTIQAGIRTLAAEIWGGKPVKRSPFSYEIRQLVAAGSELALKQGFNFTTEGHLIRVLLDPTSAVPLDCLYLSASSQGRYNRIAMHMQAPPHPPMSCAA